MVVIARTNAQTDIDIKSISHNFVQIPTGAKKTKQLILINTAQLTTRTIPELFRSRQSICNHIVFGFDVFNFQVELL